MMICNWRTLIPVVLTCCISNAASAKLPPPPAQDPAKAAQSKKRAAERARHESKALDKAQDRAVEYYRRHHLGIDTAKGKRVPRVSIERLSCKLGTEDRHARIAVELVSGRVKSIAYYSKWKPRTCSLYIVRDDAFSQWKDAAGVTVVTLNEDKGAFLINYGQRAVKFLFRNIDRERFCGMVGKITGSLTVSLGRDRCKL